MIRPLLPARLGLLMSLLVFFFASLTAQTIPQPKEKAREIALQFLRENPAQFALSASDVADVQVINMNTSKGSGAVHVWLLQQHAGIPVHNGLFGLHVLPDGSVAHVGHRFIADLGSRVNTNLPALSAQQALQLAMNDLGFNGFTVPRLKTKTNAQNWLFEGGAISKKDITVSACYEPVDNGAVRLAWALMIDQANTSDLWAIRIDAITGLVIGKENLTITCQIDAKRGSAQHEACQDEQPAVAKAAPANSDKAAGMLNASESYRILPLPTESPIHGPFVLVTNPADPVASPFGWLDTNGADGPEYTYTRGNNAWAFEDSADDNTPDPSESADGGPTFTFDFPFDQDLEPEDNLNAATTNLFYMNNMMHDITYHYGFDEEGGNYQQNTYGHTGVGGDPVLAQSIDGSGTNNANFTPSVDGIEGRIQMYKWTRQGGKLVKVNAPNQVQGYYDAILANGWGGAITATPLTADGIVTFDDSSEPTFGCQPPSIDVSGKIVLIDRGSCEFGLKALTAEEAGAVGCIICNYADDLVNMGDGAVGLQVTIPVVSMGKSDCDKLRQYSGAGLNITFQQPSVTGPEFYDGDFDNGVIAHEYGHGISTRLTGSPSVPGCLTNAEEMGEGWSDFFALVTTGKPTATGADTRPMATYVWDRNITGGGLRNYPYSTDMSIDPHVFADVAANPEVHDLGEVWCSMIWDMYWAMADQYGFDADWTNINSGNGRAIQLVMEGMKLQPCAPGFVDGRDAILLADKLMFGGADTCLITTVFARRGLGVGASQGDPDNASDGIESFEPIPTCLKELKIKKETSTPTINAGDVAQFTITVTNHKDQTLTDVVVTDQLPAGLTLINASNGGTAAGGVVTWNLGDMPSGQVITLTYSAQSDPGVGSLSFFRDQMEGSTQFDWFTLWTKGDVTFYQQNSDVKVGTAAWTAEEPNVPSDMTMQYLQYITIAGDKPVLRFWHKYDTEKGNDAGIVEFQKEGVQSWTRVPCEKVIRAPYTGPVQYETFVLPYLDGFSGNSNGWVQSYIDLSDFAGQSIWYRFRFATNGSIAGNGWVIDENEMMDMVNYDGEVCVQSAQGDNVCTKAPEAGVIVNPIGMIATHEAAHNNLALSVQPNPAHDMLYLSLAMPIQGAAHIQLIGSEGRVALEQTRDNGIASGEVIGLDVQQVPAGVYMLRVETGTGTGVQKVIIR